MPIDLGPPPYDTRRSRIRSERRREPLNPFAPTRPTPKLRTEIRPLPPDALGLRVFVVESFMLNGYRVPMGLVGDVTADYGTACDVWYGDHRGLITTLRKNLAY